ncbi:MAG: NADPH-dependent 7-cyano-7-deazaguanine reductase QueF [Proteobacteria bacterium]|nr:NADPH-dependent 7-cyano-7-deazaguanine reductase QueF [Pseudomonadota bacterium]
MEKITDSQQNEVAGLNLPLGRKVTYPRHYCPEVLRFIPRQISRTANGIGSVLPFKGFDYWNAWEFSYLYSSGKPAVRILKLAVPAESENIVESKSLKLYLNSFNYERFDSDSAIGEAIKKDLSAGFKCSFSLELLPLSGSSVAQTAVPADKFQSIDSLEVENPSFKFSPDSLAADSDTFAEEYLYSDLLKSNCPVTSQPDWGSVFIHYKGKKISHTGLLLYILSFRDINEFHESCAERIFSDIKRICSPEILTVQARYTRRGGIDINPLRTDCGEFSLAERTVRQ